MLVSQCAYTSPRVLAHMRIHMADVFHRPICHRMQVCLAFITLHPPVSWWNTEEKLILPFLGVPGIRSESRPISLKNGRDLLSVQYMLLNETVGIVWTF